MKTVLLILAFVMSFAAFAVNNSIDQTGAVQTRVAQYVKVKNGSAGALTRGLAVCLDLTDDDGINVDLCSADGAKPVGVITDVSCAVGAFCKLQTKGYFAYGNFDYIATTLVAGGMVYAASASGKLVFPATRTVDMFPVGAALDGAAADTTSLEIYIDL